MGKEKGVLLVNLGSPKSTKVKDVRKYLQEFLMDERVIDIPFISRFLLVNGIIAPFRAKKSAAAYRKIWWEEGSPLVVISQRLQKKVSEKSTIPVGLAMRYGEMSIRKGMEDLYQKGVQDLFVIPLYPQYAMSTTETVVEKCLEEQKHFPDLNLSFQEPFYNEPEYIHCLASIIREHLKEEVDALLFSYHGIPERHIYKTDKTNTCEIGKCCFKEENPSHDKCYRHQCYQTTAMVAENLGISKGEYYQSFQSRLGRDPWLQPYTDETLSKFPSKGKKKVAVLAPAFVSDCLETLEEIAMEGKEEFLEAGGEQFIYIPCLNDNEDWVEFIHSLIVKFIGQ